MKTQIRTQISVQAALAAGSPEHGEIIVEPTTEQLGALDGAKRAALAPYVVKPKGVDYVRHLGVSAPGWAGVVGGLDSALAEADREAAKRAEQIEHERASYRAILAGGVYEPGALPLKRREYPGMWDGSPNYSKGDADAQRLWTDVEALRLAQATLTIREADERLGYDVVGDKLAEPIQRVLQAARDLRGELGELAPRATSFSVRLAAEQAARTKAAEAANGAALRSVVEAAGDADQIERYDAGVLPERELTELVEARLFAPFAEFNSYLFADITESDVVDECGGDADSVRFSTTTIEPSEMDPDEFARWKGVRAVAANIDGAVAELREHVGYNQHRSGSNDPEIRRQGIRVVIEFAGRKWRREFGM